MFARTVAAAAFATLVIANAAEAQIPIQFPIEPPARLLREALGHPYGRAMTEEFARNVAEGADAECLKSKALDMKKLSAFGHALLQRYGTQSFELIIKTVDLRRYDAKFAESAGNRAPAELMRLRNDAEVKKYLSLERPIRLAKVLDFVVENFDRYVLLNQIRLKSISPISTGKEDLLRANPTERSEEAIDRFTRASRSKPLKRFLELSEVAGTALIAAFNTHEVLKWGPRTFFGGVEKDLAEVCVGSGR